MTFEQDLQETEAILDYDHSLGSVSELDSGQVYIRKPVKNLPYGYMELAVVRVRERWLGFVVYEKFLRNGLAATDQYLTPDEEYENSYSPRGAYVNIPRIHEVIQFDSLEYLTENGWEIAGYINSIKQGQLQASWEEIKRDISYRLEFSEGYVEGDGDESATAQVERLYQELKLALKDNQDWKKSYDTLYLKLQKAEEKINYLNKKYEVEYEHDVTVSASFEFKLLTYADDSETALELVQKSLGDSELIIQDKRTNRVLYRTEDSKIYQAISAENKEIKNEK